MWKLKKWQKLAIKSPPPTYMVERTRAVASASNIAIYNNVTITYDVAITYVQFFLNLKLCKYYLAIYEQK